MLLYRYIKAGKLSRTPDGLIDTAELLRAGLVLQTSDVTTPVTMLHDVTPSSVTPQTPVTLPVTEAVTPAASTETRTLERLVDVLQRELDAARQRETMLLQMLQQVQQQSQRLLDMPRSAPAPPESAPLGRSPADTPVPTRVVAPARAPFPTRGAARQRILALLREYPEGLTAAELRVLLGAEQSLTDTCAGMFKDGLLRRVARGRYVVA